MIDSITQYFKDLSPSQREQFEEMMRLYPEWNAKINVISRKDIDNLEIHHILHSLAIAKFIKFMPETNILDLGCGGGFPSIPLAVIFRDCNFLLVDRVAKKLRVASEIAKTLGLENVTVQHGDISECKTKVEFIVSRAVMPLPELIKLSRKNISAKQFNSLPNGLITLKGGQLDAELKNHRKQTLIEPVSSFFPEYTHFQEKYVTYTPIAPQK